MKRAMRKPRTVTYPRDAIVEVRHLMAAFGVSDESIAKMDLPCFYIGNRVRFVWGEVLDHLTKLSHPDTQPTREPRQRRKQRTPANRCNGTASDPAHTSAGSRTERATTLPAKLRVEG